MLARNSKLIDLHLQSLRFHLLFFAKYKTLNSIQHVTVTNHSSLLITYSLTLLFFLLAIFTDCFVISEFVSTGTGPTRSKVFAWATGTCFFGIIVVLIEVFADTFKILRSIDGDVVEIDTFASCKITFDLFFDAFQ